MSVLVLSGHGVQLADVLSSALYVPAPHKVHATSFPLKAEEEGSPPPPAVHVLSLSPAETKYPAEQVDVHTEFTSLPCRFSEIGGRLRGDARAGRRRGGTRGTTAITEANVQTRVEKADGNGGHLMKKRTVTYIRASERPVAWTAEAWARCANGTKAKERH